VTKTLVIIPAYNERDNIQKLISQIFSLNVGLDILIVDDGQDGTDKLVLEMKQQHPDLFLIKRANKAGRGSAVIEGLKFGLGKNYEYLVEMDADFSHDPGELPQLLDKVAPDTVVIGSRYVRGSKIAGWPAARRIFSKLANFYAGVVLGLGYHDYTNGYRVYPRVLVRQLNFAAIRSAGFVVLSEIAHQLSEIGAKFVEVPIVFVNRKRGASNFSLREIRESFLSILRIKFSIWEIVILVLLAASFFIGLNHGFPLTNVVGDEAPNVGGVLRALERKTLLPASGDVPYATVTYLLSYVFIVIYLLAAFPFFHFDLGALKLHLLENPHELYFVTRLSSALIGVAAIFFLYRLTRRAGVWSSRQRVSIVLLVMSNILIAAIFHTTKVWVLSTFFALLSIYYLYDALKTKDLSSDLKARRAVFLSILFACLGLANFPLNFYAVAATLVVLFLAFRKEKIFFSLVLKSLIFGLAVIAIVTLMNWQNIFDQVAAIFPSDRASSAGIEIGAIAQAFLVNFKRIFLLFPFLLLPLLAARGIRDRALLRIALLYLGIYLAALSATATWVSGTAIFLRYLVPVGFFLGLVLASLRFRFSWILPACAGVSAIYYIFTLVYLTLPTTYNQVYRFTLDRFNSDSVIIVNEASWLQLPLNARSAELLQERFCASRCQQTISNDLQADFRSLVFDERRSKPELYASLSSSDSNANFFLYTSEKHPDLAGNLVATFGNSAPGQQFSVNHRLGTYFDWRYLKLEGLGENIYIYETAKLPPLAP
jgi:dolichol-phosphate mannosyltransferase